MTIQAPAPVQVQVQVPASDLHLYRYTPLIKSGEYQGIDVFFSSEEGIYAQVFSLKGRKILPLKGYPKELEWLPNQLRKLFSSAYFTVEKEKHNIPSYVRVSYGLKGGVIGVSDQDILPMYPGYALGNVIRRGDFLLPLLQKKLTALKEESKQIEDEYRKIKNYSEEKKNDKEQKQHYLLVIHTKRVSNQKNFNKVLEEIEKVQKAQPLISIQETLPIDYKKSDFKIKEYSFISEKMDYITLSKKSNVKHKIDLFMSELEIQGGVSPNVSISTLEGLASRINFMLKEINEVCLVGSFVALSKVKKMDPIVLRKKEGISDELRKNANNYFVLTEAVLGGVFLGFGESKSKAAASNAQSQAADVSFFSFIAQGAAPKLSGSHGRNLWDTYKSWRTELLSGSGSGYPIGFKVRKLSDVFKENGITMMNKTDSLLLSSSSGSSNSK